MLSLNRALSGVHVQSALAAEGTATLSVDGDEEGADPVVVSVALERGASDSEAPSGDWQVCECRAVSDCGRIVANVMRGLRAEGSAPPTVRELVRALSIRARSDLALQRELEQLRTRGFWSVRWTAGSGEAGDASGCLDAWAMGGLAQLRVEVPDLYPLGRQPLLVKSFTLVGVSVSQRAERLAQETATRRTFGSVSSLLDAVHASLGQ